MSEKGARISGRTDIDGRFCFAETRRGKDGPEPNRAIDRIAPRRAVAGPPAGRRQVFHLYEVEGYQHREIAQLLRCPVGNSKAQLHKARLKMRNGLLPKKHVLSSLETARPKARLPNHSLEEKAARIEAEGDYTRAGGYSRVVKTACNAEFPFVL